MPGAAHTGILRASWAAAFAAFSLSCLLGSGWERLLEPRWPGGTVLYAQSSDAEPGSEEEPAQGPATQRIRRAGAVWSAEYGFRNFNQDRLSVSFQLPKPAFDAYEARFGYSDRDHADLKAWHEAARQAAFQAAVKARRTQAQLDAETARLRAQFDAKVRDYMSSRGFKILPGNLVAVDMPRLVRDNSGPLKPLARAFDEIAETRRYDSESLIGAATSLVQTAMVYRIPPSSE